jgi:hypothetical protein
VAAAIAEDPAADLVIVEPGTQVGTGWLERLREAAYRDGPIASASAVAAAAAATTENAARPRIAIPRPGALYLRRDALQLVGWPVDAATAAEALAEFARRTLACTLGHVLVDDVIVAVPGGRLDSAVSEDELAWADAEHPSPALRRALRGLEIASEGLSVTIDARALGPRSGGTQVFTLGLITALAARDDLRVRVLAAFDLADDVAQDLRHAGVEILGYDEAVAGGPVARTHVLHRPEQVFNVEDLFLLRKLGERFVMTQQDLITYRARYYHPSMQQWQAHRSATQLALALADRVTFFSQHALEDAVGEDLLAREDGVVIPPGSGEAATTPATAPPAALGSHEPFLLCLGADYAHKNRPFAIRLLRELRAAHGWNGHLVFAGAHVAHGSSAEAERAALAVDPELPAFVVDAGSVTGAERQWLMEHAAAVVYPTLYEGFGLLPLEAAQAGVPCLYAAQSALIETAGKACATLVPWNAEASADAAAPLLEAGAAREAHVAGLREATRVPLWSEIAARFAAVYHDAAQRAVTPPAWPFWEAAERESALRQLRDEVGALATPALGGVLSAPVQRGLLRLAGRPALRRIVFGPVGLLGRRETRGESDPRS